MNVSCKLIGMRQATPPNIEELKGKMIPVLMRYRVQRAGIFGSAARGEFRPGSDVDLLVELPEGSSLLDVVGLKLELEDKLGMEVDVGEYNAIKPRIKEKVIAEQIRIL